MDLIIGAGVTGLSYARFTKNDYKIIERSDSYGGYCKTIKQDGFTWDYSGHFFHFKSDKIKEMIFNDLNSQTVYDVNKITSIYHKGNYVDFPFQKNIHMLPKSDFIDCLYGLSEASGKEGSTFKEMLINNYGRGISDRFLIPYNEKLYACDLDSLDKDAMGRFFPHANLKEIIKNFKHSNSESYNNNFLYPEGGAIEYIHALAKGVDLERIKYNTELDRIDLDNKVAHLSTGEEIKYNRIISTMPFNKLMEMTGLTENKESFKCNKVAVFNLGFDIDSDNNEHWIYYPDKETIFYRVGFYNNIYSSGKMSLYVEMGYSENEEIPGEEKLLEKVLLDLKKVGVITNQKLISHKFLVMNPAYVHVNSISSDELENKMNQLKSYDVYSAGRYGAWKYCSIEDNIIEALELADKLEAEK